MTMTEGLIMMFGPLFLFIAVLLFLAFFPFERFHQPKTEVVKDKS